MSSSEIIYIYICVCVCVYVCMYIRICEFVKVYDLLSYRKDFLNKHFYKVYDSALEAVSFIYINTLFNFFSSKILRLTIDSAASSANQGKLKYFLYFPWSPFETRMSISKFCSYFNAVRS